MDKDYSDFCHQLKVTFPQQVVNTPCLSAPAESTPESSPVKIWPLKPLPTEKVWIFFLPDACFIISSPRWKSQIIDIPGDFLNFTPISFDIIPVVSLRQPLVSTRFSSGLQHSLVTFFPKYNSKLLGYNRLVFIQFYQLFMVSWKSYLKPFW